MTAYTVPRCSLTALADAHCPFSSYLYLLTVLMVDVVLFRRRLCRRRRRMACPAARTATIVETNTAASGTRFEPSLGHFFCRMRACRRLPSPTTPTVAYSVARTAINVGQRDRGVEVMGDGAKRRQVNTSPKLVYESGRIDIALGCLISRAALVCEHREDRDR